MKAKFFRTAAMVALLSASLPFNVLAANANITVNDVAGAKPGENVNIQGTSSLPDVVVKVVKPDNTVLYFDVVKPSPDGKYSTMFTMPTEASNAPIGEYTIVAGSGSDVATDKFTVSNAGNGSNDRSSNDRGGGGGTPAPSTTPTVPVPKPTPVPTPTPAPTPTVPANPSPEPAPSFRDLGPVVSWAKEAIEHLAQKGIVHGVDASGSFAPLKQVTRAEFIAMLVNAMGMMDEKASASFKDVKKGEWYYQAVASATANKLVSGIGKNQFAPKKPITREEMAAMMANALKVTKGKKVADVNGKLAKFKDKNNVAPYAKEAVALLLQEDIVHGTTAATFSPKNKASRAEAAVVIKNVLDMK
ncbi:S-layer homology domain-containing protein [Aneurinibacillus tyrosinisolvens]|uniref:S-layer homology domain-containing protein n=1 Tax=Aneurinibacillus tyrosinisolvens TaxID=1443435 RepID=UPI00069CB898|nr:S-layer homology domain-containing protein [Aneurinibacillus tyrosinisolvens]